MPSASTWAQSDSNKDATSAAKPADKSAAADKDAKAADKDKLPPLPPDAHVAQRIQLDGKTLNYTVTVGALPVRDKDGKNAGEVVFTAYTVDGAESSGDLRLQRRPGRIFGLSELWRHRAQACSRRQRGRQPVRSGDAEGQSRHLARFHRSGVHRSHRHRLQPLAGSRRPRPRSSSTPPSPTSNIFRASSTTGW